MGMWMHTKIIKIQRYREINHFGELFKVVKPLSTTWFNILYNLQLMCLYLPQSLLQLQDDRYLFSNANNNIRSGYDLILWCHKHINISYLRYNVTVRTSVIHKQTTLGVEIDLPTFQAPVFSAPEILNSNILGSNIKVILGTLKLFIF